MATYMFLANAEELNHTFKPPKLPKDYVRMCSYICTQILTVYGICFPKSSEERIEFVQLNYNFRGELASLLAVLMCSSLPLDQDICFDYTPLGMRDLVLHHITLIFQQGPVFPDRLPKRNIETFSIHKINKDNLFKINIDIIIDFLRLMIREVVIGVSKKISPELATSDRIDKKIAAFEENFPALKILANKVLPTQLVAKPLLAATLKIEFKEPEPSLWDP